MAKFFINLKKDNGLKHIAILLLLGSCIVRIYGFPFSNADMNNFNLLWYQTLVDNGIVYTLATGFTNYTPPYTYFLAITTLFRNFIPPLVAIKLIPTAFDLIGVVLIYKITKLKYQQGNIPLLAAALYFATPTIVLNSSYWGEVDSLYVSFLLLFIYFLLTDRPLIAIIMFGISVSVKAQAAFIAPFLLVMAFKKRMPWTYFLIPPFVYLLMCIPVFMAGRPFMDVITIYISQANTNHVPSMNAPNLYALTIYPPYYVDWDIVIQIGFVIAAISIISWTVIYARRQYEVNHKMMILSMLASLALVPYVLPKMHDRYFYPADVFSLIFAFYYPAFWFIPLLFQGASGIMYYVFLGSVDPGRFHILFPIAAGLCTVAVMSILVKQHRDTTSALKV